MKPRLRYKSIHIEFIDENNRYIHPLFIARYQIILLRINEWPAVYRCWLLQRGR